MSATIVFDYYSSSRRKVVSLLNEMQMPYVETSSVSGFLNKVGFNTDSAALPVILLLGDRSSQQEILSLTFYIKRYKPDIQFFIYTCDNSISQAGLNTDNYKVFQGDETELVKTVQQFVSAQYAE